jgi:hypothetical protein
MSKTAKDDRYTKLRKERRMVRVSVDVNIFGEQLIRGTYHYKAEGLPEDALFVGVSSEVTSLCFDFFYLHESFEPVREGERATQVYPTLTRIFCPND